MIGRLRGTLVSRHPPWLLVDVGGVGYELQAPMSTIYELPPTGKEVVLLTHYVSRDDTVALYSNLVPQLDQGQRNRSQNRVGDIVRGIQ